MGLSNGYGVVIGQKSDYYRDPPDDYGRYYHGNLIIGTPEGNYHCAIDVDPKFMPDGIQWRVVRIRKEDFALIQTLSDGAHLLASTDTSGAVDYIRSSMLQPPTLIQTVTRAGMLDQLLGLIDWNPPWNNGTGIQALTDLEANLALGVRFYVFGEPFTTGLGIHNVHQNQGDPVGGGHDGESGIWQDGLTVIETAQGELICFLNKFKTQAFETDNLGHPI